MKGDVSYTTLRGPATDDQSSAQDAPPRVFSRQAARFELLDSQSLRGACYRLLIYTEAH